MYDLEELDALLVNWIDNYLVTNADDDVFVYLIQSYTGGLSLGILDFELPSNEALYKHRSVVKVTKLKKLLIDKELRTELLKTLMPTEKIDVMSKYYSTEREAKKEWN